MPHAWHMPAFDEALAEAFVGKHLLIGMTYLDHNDTLLVGSS